MLLLWTWHQYDILEIPMAPANEFPADPLLAQPPFLTAI